jgi:hypothetical protein
MAGIAWQNGLQGMERNRKAFAPGSVAADTGTEMKPEGDKHAKDMGTVVRTGAASGALPGAKRIRRNVAT